MSSNKEYELFLRKPIRQDVTWYRIWLIRSKLWHIRQKNLDMFWCHKCFWLNLIAFYICFRRAQSVPWNKKWPPSSSINQRSCLIIHHQIYIVCFLVLINCAHSILRLHHHRHYIPTKNKSINFHDWSHWCLVRDFYLS